MAQEAQKKVQNAVNTLLVDLDRSSLRKMQAQMFNCSARCCEDPNSSMEQVASCVEECSTKFRKAQSYISNELTSFQGRLERCAMQCQDDVRSRMTADTTDEQMRGLERNFESCVIKCAEDTVKVIPDLFKKMKSIIDKEAYHKA